MGVASQLPSDMCLYFVCAIGNADGSLYIGYICRGNYEPCFRVVSFFFVVLKEADLYMNED